MRLTSVLVFLFPLKLFAQTGEIDSLLNLLETDSEDTLKVIHLHEIARDYVNDDPRKTLEYAGQGYELSKKINFKSGMAACLDDMGMANEYQGNYDKAVDYYLRSLKIREELNDPKGIATSLNNVGVVYYYLYKYDKAIQYYERALKINEETGALDGQASALGNIGIIYDEEGNYPKALEYFNRAFEIFRKLDNKNAVAACLNNIGMLCMNMKDYGKALEIFRQSLEMKKALSDRQGESTTLNNMGLVYLKQSKSKEAIETFQQGLSIAREINSKEDMKSALLNLSDAYKQLNRFDSAYKYLTLHSFVKDSLLNEESHKQIAEMQTKYETEKKEQQIQLLNKDKEIQDASIARQQIIIWSVAAGFLVVLVFSMFIYKERKKSEKLLLNILPAQTAKELKKKGKATAKYYESVTVMFTDFKGFTSIAEKLSAEELVSELDFIFRKFDEIISKYKIEKIKTIGDAYMCVSGLPAPVENHAEEIVKAGLEIQQWMISQNGKWNLRIGIHSGSVTAGVVGDKKFAYDIWGDAVNVASRMESSGEAGKVNISGSTYELISPHIKEKGWEVSHRGKIPAKNKGEIDMYFVKRYS